MRPHTSRETKRSVVAIVALCADVYVDATITRTTVSEPNIFDVPVSRTAIIYSVSVVVVCSARLLLYSSHWNTVNCFDGLYVWWEGLDVDIVCWRMLAVCS